MSDRELITAAQAGDAEAFGQLVVRYQRAAYGHAISLLGRREEAGDAMQDSFLAAFRALRGLDPERPFFPWFYVILRNRCLSTLRRRRHEQPLDGCCVAAVEKDAGPRVEELRQALSQMPVEDREILVLKYIDGRPYREIAEMLGIPAGTVASRLHAARCRLTAMIRRDDDQERWP
jgi:RNA polymerase sigma-70 factor, ECF subfamily